MKKYYFFITFLLLCACAYGQQLPLNRIAPHRAAFFQETTGRAIVNDETLTYWLYQSLPNNLEELVGYLHSYVESLGYTIDFDSHSGMFENPHLATSVRSLMSFQKRNISITIWNNMLIINIDTEGVGPIIDRRYFFVSWRLVR